MAPLMHGRSGFQTPARPVRLLSRFAWTLTKRSRSLNRAPRASMPATSTVRGSWHPKPVFLRGRTGPCFASPVFCWSGLAPSPARWSLRALDIVQISCVLCHRCPRGPTACGGCAGAWHIWALTAPCTGDVITGDVIKCSDAEMGLALRFETASQIRQGYWDATNRVKVHTGEGG